MVMTIGELEESVSEFFADTRRSRAETLDDLEQLACHVEGYIENLKSSDEEDEEDEASKVEEDEDEDEISDTLEEIADIADSISELPDVEEC